MKKRSTQEVALWVSITDANCLLSLVTLVTPLIDWMLANGIQITRRNYLDIVVIDRDALRESAELEAGVEREAVVRKIQDIPPQFAARAWVPRHSSRDRLSGYFVRQPWAKQMGPPIIGTLQRLNPRWAAARLLLSVQTSL